MARQAKPVASGLPRCRLSRRWVLSPLIQKGELRIIAARVGCRTVHYLLALPLIRSRDKMLLFIV